MLEQDMTQILYTSDQIATRVAELAEQISRDYADTPPLVVGILRGSIVFLSDLIREIDLPIDLDFMSASSYGSTTSSSGAVNIKLDLSQDIRGRHVLLVEDILDSGNTLSKLIPELKAREPASLKLCVLLDKPDRRVRPVTVDYLGFSIPDSFVVGYGMDFAQRYRNLPYIGVLKPAIYE
ncbi:MAG: hypoxanthine phosphoribosyltransferase [Evtepia sp.]